MHVGTGKTEKNIANTGNPMPGIILGMGFHVYGMYMPGCLLMENPLYEVINISGCPLPQNSLRRVTLSHANKQPFPKESTERSIDPRC